MARARRAVRSTESNSESPRPSAQDQRCQAVGAPPTAEPPDPAPFQGGLQAPVNVCVNCKVCQKCVCVSASNARLFGACG